MLDTEFKYYIEHQEELTALYNNKHLVIVGEKVVGFFDTDDEAYISALENHELGTFLIQHCYEGQESYTTILNTRVRFK